MTEMPDPSKLVAVFEHLFGPKLGRIAAQCLLALAAMAAAIWLVHIMWEYGGKSLYTSLSFPKIQWQSTNFPFDNLLAFILTMMFMLIVYSVVLLGILYLFMRRVFRQSVPQEVLDKLADLRSKAIHEVLNGKVETESDLTAWKVTDDAWREDVLRILKKHFPKSEVLGFERLGIIQPAIFPHQFNNEHSHRLMMFAKRLSILEDIIKSYSR